MSLKVLEYVQIYMFRVIDTNLHARREKNRIQHPQFKCTLNAMLERLHLQYRDFVIDPGNDLGRIRLCYERLERPLGLRLEVPSHLHGVYVYLNVHVTSVFPPGQLYVVFQE